MKLCAPTQLSTDNIYIGDTNLQFCPIAESWNLFCMKSNFYLPTALGWISNKARKRRNIGVTKELLKRVTRIANCICASFVYYTHQSNKTKWNFFFWQVYLFDTEILQSRVRERKKGNQKDEWKKKRRRKQWFITKNENTKYAENRYVYVNAETNQFQNNKNVREKTHCLEYEFVSVFVILGSISVSCANFQEEEKNGRTDKGTIIMQHNQRASGKSWNFHTKWQEYAWQVFRPRHTCFFLFFFEKKNSVSIEL